MFIQNGEKLALLNSERYGKDLKPKTDHRNRHESSQFSSTAWFSQNSAQYE